MPPVNPALPLLVMLSAGLALGGCEKVPPEERAEEKDVPAEPRGTYEIDPETGETSARYTAEDGTTTVMRSGETVPVLLPKGFSIYPGAKVVNNTRVERPGGVIVVLVMTSEASVEEMIEYYREEAKRAGVDIELSLQTPPSSMIGGSAQDGSSFSFTATRKSRLTEAQLSVGRGIT